MNIRELQEKRSKTIADARTILDRADAEQRTLTADEQAAWDVLMNDAEQARAEIERRERQESLERDLAQRAGGEPTRPETGIGAAPANEALNRAFNRYLRGQALGGAEYRALAADSDEAGGYLKAPQQFVNQLIRAVNNMVYLRQWGTGYQVQGTDSIGMPSLDADPADPTWTSELLIGSEDSTMDFGKRELQAKPLAKYIKVSRKLLRLVPDVEALVIERLAYKHAVVWENAGLNGSGANQPLGVFTASALGISTGRDVSTGNTTTSPTFDGLIEAKYTLKQQYWARARWIMHRDCAKLVAKLKNGDGEYIWRESTRVGEPDTLLGFPLYMSEYAPNTFTTGLYVAVLGDFSKYHYVDSLNFEVQRLDELYAATNQVGFIGRLESDGMPVLEEAFVRVKLA